MGMYKIQDIWLNSFENFAQRNSLTSEQYKASNAIINCKSGNLGLNVSQCSRCNHLVIHNNSCRNRNCPNCQAVQKELWVDKRSSEVIDSPYFHIVFTLPHELNPLIYCNQKLLYGLLHKCTAKTILELSKDKKHLGAEPGIIQVLHTWNQELGYHVHMHCIVSGGGLSEEKKLVKSSDKHFFIPIYVLRDKFKGKFISNLKQLYSENALYFSKTCKDIENESCWLQFCSSLYNIDWCPFIKETFNGFGNAIEYLGRYTHKIAISNSRIINISENTVTFAARGKKPGDPKRTIILTHEEFIRRFLMHILPKGFQRMRYYGFLNNRMKAQNLALIFEIQGKQRFKQKYINLSKTEIMKLAWNVDICKCPNCSSSTLKLIHRTFRGPS